MYGLILIKLLAAHIIVDFPLQKQGWIREKREKHWKAPTLLVHSLLQGLVAWLFIFQLQAWWIALVIIITHYFIDSWKTYRPEKLMYFFIDQIGHLLIILILWALYTGSINQITTYFLQVTSNAHFWLILVAYILALWPVGIIIQQFVQYRFNDEDSPGSDPGLHSAGKWIGYFERFLVVTLFLVSAYSAMGLLIAAKSILRISTDKNTGRKETEYILIGTLMSWSMAILVGIMLRFVLKRIS